MKLFAKSQAPILQPDPAVAWASGAVFNPGAWHDGQTTHLLFRAVPQGYRRIQLANLESGESGLGFDDYVSYIGYARSSDGVNFEVDADPLIKPEADYDRYGVEDARISFLDGRYWITYSALADPAFSPDARVRIALASTTDFRSVQKHGVIGPDERDKDAVLFPERIQGRMAMLHRIVPDIQIVYFKDLNELRDPSPGLWANHMAALDEHVVMRPQEAWEARKIGAGAPPILTSEGWLLIYHGVDADHVYRAGLALLDPNDPSRVIARTRNPVIEPELDFELCGDVDNVVFPQGMVVVDGMIHVYYGAADRVIGHASAPLSDVLAVLRLESLHAA